MKGVKNSAKVLLFTGGVAALLVAPFCSSDSLWQLCTCGAKVVPLNVGLDLFLLRTAKKLSQRFAPDDTRRLASLKDLAAIARAEEYVKVELEILELATRIFGPDHMEVTDALRALQRFYSVKPYQFHTMLEYGYRATNAIERSLGKAHPYLADQYSWMGRLCFFASRNDLAESFRRKASELRMNSDWDYNGSKFAYRADLAAQLETQGKYGEAAALYEETIAALIKAGKAREGLLQETLKDAALVQLRLGDNQQALRLYRQAAECVGKTKKESGEQDNAEEKEAENAVAVSLHLSAHDAEDNDGNVVAKRLYALSEQAFERTGDEENACKLQMDVLRSQVQTGEVDGSRVINKAKAALAKLQELCTKTNDFESLADTQAQMGIIYAASGQLSQSTACFADALAVAEKNHCPESKIDSYRDALTVLFARRSMFDQCVAMRREAREKELAEGTDQSDDMAQQLSRFALSEQWEKVIALCRSEIGKLDDKQSLDTIDRKIMLSGALTSALRSANRIREAASQCDVTLALLKDYAELAPAELDYVEALEIDTLADKGSLAFACGDLLLAGKTYDRALKHHFNGAAAVTRAELLCSAAVTRREAGDFTQAGKLYNEAEQLCLSSRHENASVYRTIVLELSALAMDRGELDSAGKSLEKAMGQFGRKSPADQSLDDVFWIWYQQSRLKLLEKDYAQASKLLRDAIRLKEVISESEGYEVQYARIQLGAVLIAMHRNDQARAELNTAIEGLVKIGTRSHYKLARARKLLEAL